MSKKKKDEETKPQEQPAPELSAEPPTPALNTQSNAGEAAAIRLAELETLVNLVKPLMEKYGWSAAFTVNHLMEQHDHINATLRPSLGPLLNERNQVEHVCELIKLTATDGPVYQAGRQEGHADIAAALRARLGARFEKVNLDGLLDGVKQLADGDEAATLRTLLGPQGHCRGLLIRAQGTGFVLVKVEAGEGRVTAKAVEHLLPDPKTGKKVKSTVGPWSEVRDWWVRLFNSWVTPQGFR